MKKQFVILIILLLCAAHFSIAGNGHEPAGARAWGMGGTSVARADLWSAYNNQAGLGSIKKFSAGICGENRFGLKELTGSTIAVVLPVKPGTFALTYHTFGYSAFREQKAGLAYGRAFTKNFLFGFQLNYLNTQIAEYGSNHKLCIEAGIQAQLLKELKMGVHVFNPTMTRMASYNNERISTLGRIALSYEPSKKLLICAELEKNSAYPFSIRTGLEYKISEHAELRAGVSTKPFLTSFGFRIHIKKFSIDIASAYQQLLGFTPHFSINFEPR